MSQTLSQLRSRVQNKLNQSGTSAIFQPAEIDDNIRAGVRHVAYYGEKELIQSSLFKQSNIPVSGDPSTIIGGKINKPGDYFRFVFARLGGRRCVPIEEHDIDNMFYNSAKMPGAKNKYIAEYSGSQFSVWGSNGDSPASFHYIGTISGTLLQGDSENSPLTDNGDDYVVDWAFALCLESKNFAPEQSTSIFNRVHNLLTKTDYILPSRPIVGGRAPGK
jgi:hypothetical protein